MLESGWCAILVVVMNLLRHISCHDRVPPSRVTERSLAPIGIGTCPGRLWVSSVIPQPSSHVLQASVCSDTDTSCLGILSVRRAIGRENGVFSSGAPLMNHSLPELDLFFGTHGGGVIPSLSCVSWRFRPGWTPLPCVPCRSPSGT